MAAVTLTLTLDPAIRHIVVHHSSTSTYIPNFIEIEEIFCGRTDGHLRPILLGRLPNFGSRPRKPSISEEIWACALTEAISLCQISIQQLNLFRYDVRLYSQVSAATKYCRHN